MVMCVCTLANGKLAMYRPNRVVAVNVRVRVRIRDGSTGEEGIINRPRRSLLISLAEV